MSTMTYAKRYTTALIKKANVQTYQNLMELVMIKGNFKMSTKFILELECQEKLETEIRTSFELNLLR